MAVGIERRKSQPVAWPPNQPLIIADLAARRKCRIRNPTHCVIAGPDACNILPPAPPAHLGKRLLGDMAQELGLLLEVGEEGVEFGLDALAHSGEHQRHQRGDGELAAAGERRGMLGMASAEKEFGRVQLCG